MSQDSTAHFEAALKSALASAGFGALDSCLCKIKAELEHRSSLFVILLDCLLSLICYSA